MATYNTVDRSKLFRTGNVSATDFNISGGTAGQALITDGSGNLSFGDVGSLNVYATIDDLPLSGQTNGTLSFVTATKRLYIWSGTGWYNIALINTNPSITNGYSDSYFLEIDGTPTVITLVGSDPEGIPLTWSYEVTSGSLTNGGGVTATVSNVDNVFTITPTTTQAYAGTFSITFKASDGVNIGTAVSSFTLVFRVVDSKYTSLLVKGLASGNNATFVDSSVNNFTITKNGDTTQGTFGPFSQADGAWSVLFDGITDLITYPSSPDFNLGSDWTVECWVYFNAYPTVYNRTFMFGINGNPNSMGIAFDTSGYPGAGLGYSNGGIIGGTTAVPLGTWTHVVWTRDSSANEARIYINGTLTDTNSGPAVQSAGDVGLRLGYDNVATVDGKFNGYISNIRITKSVVYSTNFTPIIEPLTTSTSPVLLTAQSNRFKDNSSSLHNSITFTGSPKISSFGPFDRIAYNPIIHGGGAYFDGTGDYLSMASSSPVYLTADPFTIESWVYPTANAGIIIGRRSAVTATGFWLSYGNVTANKFSFYAGDSSTSSWEVQLTSSSTFGLNQWHHVAITRSAANVFTLWVNGQSQGTATASFTISSDTSTLYVGVADGANSPFSGYMSDIRLVKSALYTSSFSPPTAPLIDDTTPSAGLLLNFTNADIIDNDSKNNLKLVGNTAASATQTKYAARSVYFDGTGDYIIPNNVFDGFTSTSMPWTIEFWIYPVTASWAGVEVPIGINAISDGSNCFLWRGDSIYITATGYNLSAAPTAGSWQHIAITYNGTTITCYLDGTSVYSATHTIPTAFANCVLGIGAEFDASNAGTPGNYFNGYIEDLRITKGLVRYTTNFTPPTTELLG